jgi:hypothetical protein
MTLMTAEGKRDPEVANSRDMPAAGAPHRARLDELIGQSTSPSRSQVFFFAQPGNIASILDHRISSSKAARVRDAVADPGLKSLNPCVLESLSP